MNEVEKMYSNAGIEPINFAKKGVIDFTNTIEIDGKRYPDFTPEKQLELIKWFAHKAPNGLLINKHITNSGASMVFDNSLFASTSASSSISFEECLANLVNNAWIDLLKEERKQIKNILESEVRE